MELGALSVIPVLIAIVGSLITRRPFEFLLLGSITGCIIMYGWDFIAQWVALLQTTIEGNVWIILICGLFGSLIALLTKARGTEGFSRFAEKLCKTGRSSRIATFILGVVIFVDDYLNMLTVGNCMRPISDKRKQPRESLAFITGATGTPVCMLLPFSTWAAFYIDLFQKQAEVQAMNFVSGMDLFMHFLPYNFFSIIMVAVTFLFALGVIPPIGPMKKAYKRVEAGGTLWSEKSNADNVEFELEYDVPTDNVAITEAQADIRAMEAAGDAGAVAVAINDESTGQGKLSAVENTAPEAKEAEKSGQLIDFVIPMGALIVLTFVQDILVGVAVALVVCLVQYLIRKKMNVAEWTDTVYEGFKDMIPTLLTLMAAFMVARRRRCDGAYALGHRCGRWIPAAAAVPGHRVCRRRVRHVCDGLVLGNVGYRRAYSVAAGCLHGGAADAHDGLHPVRMHHGYADLLLLRWQHAHRFGRKERPD